MMKAEPISERSEIRTGDRIRMTFSVMNIAERFLGWAFPQWGRDRWDERMQEAKRALIGRQNEHGFSVLDYRPSYETNTLIVDVRITDATRYSRGLSGVPVVAVWAVAYVIISITAAIGINMALRRVERIVETPTGAIALAAIAIAGIYLYRRKVE